MSQTGFRFLINRAGVVSLNNLHNVYLPRYSEEEVEALLAYLNSSVANAITKRSGRTYSRGLHKIEPNELKDIPVIDPANLSQNEVKTLSSQFRNLCEASRNSKYKLKETKQELDHAVIDVSRLDSQALELLRQGEAEYPSPIYIPELTRPR
jgi:hypothetical protein